LKRRLWPFVPAVLWGCFLLYLGGRERLPRLPAGFQLDKVAHFGIYGVLGALAAAGWLRAGRRPAAHWLIIAGAAVGLIDELHQATLPHRTAEVADWIMDALGVLAGFVLVVYLSGARLARDRR
jgi:VanZ family protein